jgi:hypothetical protein
MQHFWENGCLHQVLRRRPPMVGEEPKNMEIRQLVSINLH